MPDGYDTIVGYCPASSAGCVKNNRKVRNQRLEFAKKKGPWSESQGQSERIF
ncbi:MAG: hypothetical protein GQF41_2974 [Candidatus Rifleibacterium amylolyticum]|nr:MAG: hypothetical protein GQF41_2974 [Candidatus Rifleibacterium amylolyticum]